MAHHLDGCYAKAQWAKAHVETLDLEIGSYMKPKPPGRNSIIIDRKPWPKAPDYLLYVSVRTPPPLEKWALLIGDAVHNLRGVLDHLTWQCAVRHLRREPTPEEAPRIQFPITDTDGKWKGAVGRLTGLVSPSDIDWFERFQPRERGNYASRHPLAVLRELSNIDKHRILHLSRVETDFTPLKFQAPPGYAIENVALRARVAIKDDAKIGTLRLRSIGAGGGEPRVGMYGLPESYVVLQDRPLRTFGDGGRVNITLRKIGAYSWDRVVAPLGQSF